MNFLLWVTMKSFENCCFTVKWGMPRGSDTQKIARINQRENKCPKQL